MNGEDGMCGRLSYSMHGIRDAAQSWYQECSSLLIQIGFRQGKASPCTFYRPTRGIRTYVHGGDYVSVGKPEQLRWMKGQLEEKYTAKTQTLGAGEEDQRELAILNRVVTWSDIEGVGYEVDPRHVEIIFKQFQLEDVKPVSTFGTREEARTSEDQDVVLGDKEVIRYRALVARCNYLSPDRFDIAYIVKDLVKATSTPRKGDLQRLKRLARYLKGKPRSVMKYGWQNTQSIATAYSDADWAGCRDTRKSTTGGCINVGSHCTKGWSKTQAVIALSSGGSEFYVALEASAEFLGLLSMMRDLGWELHGEVYGSANAALGVNNMNGFGEARHIHTGLLWIQQVAAEERLKFGKVLGTNNPADLFTKYFDEKTNNHHTDNLGYHVVGGRSSDAPNLHNVGISMDEYQNGGNILEWE